MRTADTAIESQVPVSALDVRLIINVSSLCESFKVDDGCTSCCIREAPIEDFGTVGRIFTVNMHTMAICLSS
jgi:hypothetical protein